MSKKKEGQRKHLEPKWKHAPDEHDFPAARDYLALLMEDTEIDAVVEAMAGAETIYKHAKDILRASTLPELPTSNRHVASDLEKIKSSQPLSPILLIRGDSSSGIPLVIADGYHRVCAVYSIDENAEVPCRLVGYPKSSLDTSSS
jgi:hypothetical protein